MSKANGRPRALSHVADDVVVRALDDAAGVLSDAARLLKMQGIKVSRQTLSRHVSERPDLQEALKTIEAAKIDFAESVLFNRVKAGDGPSTHFLLAMKAKDRGYAKSSEVTVAAKPNAASSQIVELVNVLGQEELRVLHVIASRAFGKRSPMDDELVAKGVVPPREADYDPGS